MKKTFLSLLAAVASTVSFAQNPCPDPVVQPVMHWNFNNNITEQVSGITGNIYFQNSTITTTPTFVAGRDGTPNGAVRLMASYINQPYDPIMNLNSWTIKATVKIRDWNMDVCQGNSILWRGTQGSGNHYSLYYFDNAFDNDCNVRSLQNELFTAGASGPSPLIAADVINNPIAPGTTSINPYLVDAQWYCVVASYDDATEIMNVWVNNQLVLHKKWTNGNTGPTNDPLYIGRSNSPIGSLFDYWLMCDIDDIEVYDVVLDCPFTIAELCGCQNNPDPTPIAHWNFDNGSLVDDINGMTGVISTPGSVVSATGSNGIPNTAMQFNGTGLINVPANPLLNVQSWTIRAIVNPTAFPGTSVPCQGSIIVSKGAQFSGDYYSLMTTDNMFDNSCGLATPNRNVFLGTPAGTTALPGATWLNGGNNPFLLTNNWYCVTASYDAVNGRIRLWVNGFLAYDHPWANQYTAPTGSPLTIGGQLVPGFNYFFTGLIDDIAIYNGAATCAMSCLRGANGLPKQSTNISEVLSDENTITVVPNPAKDNISVQIPKSWSSVKITILNSVGQLMMNDVKGTGDTYNYDIRNFASGIYYIKVDDSKHSAIQKFVKE